MSDNKRNDIRTLLEMVASVDEPDYSEVEAIAKRNGFEFAADGTLEEAE